MKVKSDHHSKFSNLSNWKEEAWKISGLQRESNPWPPRYRCDAQPTELWSHTLGARSICWVHWERGQFVGFISSRAVKWCEIYYIYNHSTNMDFIHIRIISLHWSSIAPVSQRSQVSNPIEALIFFRLLPSNCLKLIGKFTAIITLHFHLQPQYKYGFHLYFTLFAYCYKLWVNNVQKLQKKKNSH